MSDDSILRFPPPSADLSPTTRSTSSRMSSCVSRRASASSSSSRSRIRRSVALLALLQPQVVSSFLQQTESPSSLTLTRVNFRQDVDSTYAAVSGFPASVSSRITPPPSNAAKYLYNPATRQYFLPPEAQARMPPWLRSNQGHLAQDNLSTLHEAMISSYLSESEAQMVLQAIHDASGGDTNRVAGVAEFCHILVDTMEMGVSSLVAAAQHYCTCVDARETAALDSLSMHSMSGSVHTNGGASSSSSSSSSSSASATQASLQTFWDTLHAEHSHAEDSTAALAKCSVYGSAASQIARDAARLKRTEAVAQGNGCSTSSATRDDSYTNMQNLLLSETRDWRALAIRTAACLYRLRGLLSVREAVESSSQHLPYQEGTTTTHSPLSSEEVREARDALHIYAPLASRLGMHRLKNELEGAAFRLKYRRQYERCMALGQETRMLLGCFDGNFQVPTSLTVGEGMARVLRQVAENLKNELDSDETFVNAAEDVVVSARVKEPYSLWRKILKTGANKMLDVPDALALRVVLNARKESPDEPDDVTAARERALCYYVQKLCTSRWHPDLSNDGGRFKDYIESPKPNGYQSLHYTARTSWGGADWPLEIQVRTGEMHRVAEYGLAAHFDYKEKAKRMGGASTATSSDAAAPSSTVSSTVAAAARSAPADETYLQAVQEWHWQQVRGVDGTGSSGTATYHPSEEVQGEPSTKIGAGYNPAYDEDRAERVRARAERMAPYIESFTAAKSDLARNHVFVFLASSESCGYTDQEQPTGTIISLPSGSCILDALREGARRFDSIDSTCFQGKTSFGVQRNGMAAVSVTEKLQNGDVITVPTVSAVLTP